VMTDVAAEGMELPQQLQWLVAATPKEFAKKLANVHEDRSLNETLAAQGLEFIQRRYSGASTQRLLAEALARR